MGKLSSVISLLFSWLLLFGFVGWERRKYQDKMFIKMQCVVFQSGRQRWRLFDYMQKVTLAYFSSAFCVGLHSFLSNFNYAHKVQSFSQLYKATSRQYSLFICIFFILMVNRN